MDHAEDAATTTVSLERLVKLERDNALMLSFILDDKRLEFNLPPGTSMDDVNYGAVNVQDVIERLRRNERVDLSGVLTASAATKRAGGDAATQETSACAPKRLERSKEISNKSSTAKNSTDPFENMVNVGVSDGMGTAVATVEAKKADETTAVFTLDKAPSCASSGELKLPDLYSALSVTDLRELAFEIVCSVQMDEEQLETARIALDIDQELADKIQKHSEKFAPAIKEEGISARIHLRAMISAIEHFNGPLGEGEQFFKKRCRAACELLWARHCSEQNASASKKTAAKHDSDDDTPNLTTQNVLSEINRMLTLPEVDATWVESAIEMIESVIESEKNGFGYPGIFGMKLYVELLSAVFDQVEDYTLAYDATTIIDSFQPVACALGLTDETSRGVMLAFAVVRQAIAAMKDVGIDYDEGSPALALLSKARDSLHRTETKMSPAVASAVSSILSWGRFMLHDFMHTVAPPATHDDRDILMIDPEVFDVIVDITYDTAQMLGLDGVAILKDACQKSACAEYDRVRTAAMEDANVQGGDATCTSLRTIAQTTAHSADQFSAHLERYIVTSPGMSSNVTGCFAAQLGDRFKKDLYAWLESGPQLNVQSLETIWTVGDLQNALVATGGDAVEPMALDERTSVLVFTWLNVKIDDLNTIVDRCISTERWKVNKDSAPVPSAVDFLRAVNETLDGFFSLKIPAHVSALRALTEGIDAAVRKYSRSAVQSLGSAEEIVPPIPTMTRYKKAIVDDLHNNFKPEEPPRFSFEEGCVGASTLRLTSLKFLMDKMYLLEQEIIPKWKSMQRSASLLTHPNAEHVVPSADWFEGMMAGARQALRQSMSQIANHMAYSVIYRDLSGAILHNIYAQGVHRSSHNISTEILPYLDGVLGYVAVRLDSQTRNAVGSFLLQATVSGWMRVLLNGGPSRVFVANDVELLEEEIEILRDFFIAGGNGLDVAEVTARITPMSAILSMMSLSTDDLCQNYTDLSQKEMHTPVSNADDTDIINIHTADVVLRVLCHRAEHSASKWIKAHFSIRKTESAGMFGFM